MSDISKALRELRPSAVWTVDGNTYDGINWFDEHQVKPTKAEVDAHLVTQVAEYQQLEYQRLRAPEYPPIGDQLDALWKGGDAATEMLAKIQAVKAKYPKPTES